MMKRKGINPALAQMNQYQRDRVLIKSAYKANMILSLMVLRDKFDFEQEQLELFLAEVRKLLDGYNEGYLNVQDIEDTLAEEVGIKVEM